MTPKVTPTNFPWQLTLIVLLLLPILISLGFWQLHRAEEKRLLQAKFNAHQQMSPLTITQAHRLSDPNYYPVKVEGHFDNAHTYLLDNQFDNHKIGYQVITPFIIASNQPAILINRGWIPMKGNRSLIDQIPIIQNKVQVKGLLYKPHKNPLLANVFEPPASPQRILSIDIPMMAEHLHYSVYPWVILLDSQSPYGFVRHWQPVTMKASMHTGYAFQWFSMAAALVIIYIGIRIKWNN